MTEPDDLDKFEEWKQDQMDDYWAYEKYLKGFFKKQGIKLDDWEEYFNNFKTEINELQKQIDKTDKEIDQMVYDLYGLTKEEIEIVENG